MFTNGTVLTTDEVWRKALALKLVDNDSTESRGLILSHLSVLTKRKEKLERVGRGSYRLRGHTD